MKKTCADKYFSKKYMCMQVEFFRDYFLMKTRAYNSVNQEANSSKINVDKAFTVTLIKHSSPDQKSSFA